MASRLAFAIKVSRRAERRVSLSLSREGHARVMMASRALLVKQTAALLLRQPVCLTHHAADWGNANIAVVFSGCGWWDGTDVHEAAYTMYHLSRNGARFQIFAPNQQQQQVMDHARMQPSSGESRNTLSESARFSHGHGPVQVNDLAKLDANSFDGVIFPGGHGVVKNLSSFSKDGKDCKLNADVERILKEFHRARKPIGLASTAPLLACRALPGLEVTMGSEREEGGRWGRWTNTSMVQALKNMGARHSSREPYISFTDTGHEVNVDEKNKVVSTPSFMWETDYHYHYIFDGIGNMVKHVMRMTSK